MGIFLNWQKVSTNLKAQLLEHTLIQDRGQHQVKDKVYCHIFVSDQTITLDPEADEWHHHWYLPNQMVTSESRKMQLLFNL